jgi:hypothetical protein
LRRQRERTVDESKFAQRMQEKALEKCEEMRTLVYKGTEACEDAEMDLVIDTILGFMHFAPLKHETVRGRKHYVETMLGFVKKTILETLVDAKRLEDAFGKEEG